MTNFEISYIRFSFLDGRKFGQLATLYNKENIRIFFFFLVVKLTSRELWQIYICILHAKPSVMCEAKSCNWGFKVLELVQERGIFHRTMAQRISSAQTYNLFNISQNHGTTHILSTDLISSIFHRTMAQRISSAQT